MASRCFWFPNKQNYNKPTVGFSIGAIPLCRSKDEYILYTRAPFDLWIEEED